MKNYQEIVAKIVPSTIIQHLAPGIVSDENQKKIKDMYTKTQRAKALIDILIHSEQIMQKPYLSFLAGLRKNECLKELADKIEKTKGMNCNIGTHK